MNSKLYDQDELIIGAYQELFLKEIEKARKLHNVFICHEAKEVLRLIESFISEFNNLKDKITADDIFRELVRRELIAVYPDRRVRTRHLELILRSIYSRPYPNALSTLEYIILKPYISVLSSFEEHTGEELYEITKNYLKQKVDQALADVFSRILAIAFMRGIAEKESLKDGMLSAYQYSNLNTLFRYIANDLPSISLLAAPTGTGKTWIFILYAIARILEAKASGEISGVKVLIIYPRKALARDQAERILKLLRIINEELKCRNLESYKITLGIWDKDSPYYWKDVEEKRQKGMVEFRGIKCPICGRKLVYDISAKVIRCSSCKGKFDYIGDVREWIVDTEPDILITNFWAINYRLISKRFKRLLDDSIRCIIIDEAHVLRDLTGAFVSYLLCRILLRLAMQYKKLCENSSGSLKLDPKAEYDALEWIREYLRARNLSIILSSATISTAQKLKERCKDAELFAKNVIYPKIYEIFTSICKSRGFSPIIYHDYDEIYQKLYSEKPELQKLHRKINIVVIIAPHPSRGLETIAQTVMLCNLFWSKTFNQKFLFFVNNKEAIERLYHFIRDIIIRERGEIYDHVFLSDRNPGTNRSNYIYKSWKSHENVLLSNNYILIKALEDPLYWLSFTYISYLSSLISQNRNLDKILISLNSNQNIHFNNLLNLAEATCNGIFRRNTSYLEIHHADLNKARRQKIEEELKKGNLLGVLCTSTLELGIDIDNVSTIIQYKPPTAESFVQRLGRAGRRRETMYIAIGFLLISNFDILYLNEEYSSRELFNIRPALLPHDNHRIRANAIYYAMFDLLAYFGHKLSYRRRIRDADNIKNEIQSICHTLTRYEKTFKSIIASLYGLSIEDVEKEYETFKSYLQLLYANIENMNMVPTFIKNIIYNLLGNIQSLKNILSNIILDLHSRGLFSESSQRIAQLTMKLDDLCEKLCEIDLYYDAYPDYLLNRKNTTSASIKEYKHMLEETLNDLLSIKIGKYGILSLKIEKAENKIREIIGDLKAVIYFLETGLNYLFTNNLRRILR